MEISEKVAYLKGLAEGLALDTDTKEGKLIAAIIDVLDDMAEKFVDLDDEDDEDEEDYDDDESYFETTCPVCQEEIVFDEDTLDSGEIRCPKCGEKLEFDLSDLANAQDDEDDE